MGILNVDLNNINLGNTNYDEKDPVTIILIRLLAWHIKFEKRQEKELNEELMSVAWHQNRWWDWCVSEDEKKKQIQYLLKSCKSACR